MENRQKRKWIQQKSSAYTCISRNRRNFLFLYLSFCGISETLGQSADRVPENKRWYGAPLGYRIRVKFFLYPIPNDYFHLCCKRKCASCHCSLDSQYPLCWYCILPIPESTQITRKHVKWIFVVLLICSLTAFVEKDKPTGGLSEGDVAPDFKNRIYVKRATRL